MSQSMQFAELSGIQSTATPALDYLVDSIQGRSNVSHPSRNSLSSQRLVSAAWSRPT